MVQFKSWKDFHKFTEKYVTCSCLNCRGYNGSIDNGLFVCMKTLSPVRLDMIQVCVEWENKDNETLKDYEGESRFRFPDEVCDKIDNLKNATFEEIEEIIDEELKKSEGKETDC